MTGIIKLAPNCIDYFLTDTKVIKKNKEDKKKPAPNNLENNQELDERELGGEG